MGDQTIEQLLNELAEVQKMPVKRPEAQGQMIRKLQLLLANGGLFSQIIKFFPYPITIFTPQFTLATTNRAFEEEAKALGINREIAVVQIFKHKIDDMRLATAITRVFTGEMFFLEDLENPFSMFSGTMQQSAPLPDRYQKAIIFPIPAGDVEISHGVIVFMP